MIGSNCLRKTAQERFLGSATQIEWIEGAGSHPDADDKMGPEGSDPREITAPELDFCAF
jgi:hypothetical protein